MGLLHAVHFEAGVLPPELTVDNPTYAEISTVAKRTGSYALRLYSWGGYFDHYAALSLADSLGEFYLQFGFFYNTGPTSDSRILKWSTSGGTVLGGLVLDATTKKLKLYTGNFDSLVATGNTALDVSTWYVIEVYVKIADSGQLTLRIDLSEDAAFAGDTKPGADTAADLVTFGNLIIYDYNASIYLDDIIVHDTAGTRNNSWPDGARIAYLLPDGDGATKEWTPSAGSDHYAVIDEAPPSDADYLQSAAAGQITEVTLAALPEDAQAIKAVIPEAYALKGSTTAPTRLALGFDAGGGPEYSADLDLGLSAGLVRNVWEEKSGGGAFSVAEVNSMKLLLKSAA